MNVRNLKVLLKRHGIPGEVSGRGDKWEVELPDEKAKRLFDKVIGVPYGGYRSGFGSWVLSPDYQDKGDWNDSSSRHHYAADEAQLLQGLKRVAAEHPETRKHLVPLLREARKASLGEPQFIYQVAGVSSRPEIYKNVKDLLRRYKQRGVNTNRSNRAELQGQPKLEGLLGPMWGGRKGDVVTIRYETSETYRQMSI